MPGPDSMALITEAVGPLARQDDDRFLNGVVIVIGKGRLARRHHGQRTAQLLQPDQRPQTRKIDRELLAMAHVFQGCVVDMGDGGLH